MCLYAISFLTSMTMLDFLLEGNYKMLMLRSSVIISPVGMISPGCHHCCQYMHATAIVSQGWPIFPLKTMSQVANRDGPFFPLQARGIITINLVILELKIDYRMYALSYQCIDMIK